MDRPLYTKLFQTLVTAERERDEARAEVERLREVEKACRMLYDQQNGPPLRRQEGEWRTAMCAVEDALARLTAERERDEYDRDAAVEAALARLTAERERDEYDRGPNPLPPMEDCVDCPDFGPNPLPPMEDCVDCPDFAECFAECYPDETLETIHATLDGEPPAKAEAVKPMDLRIIPEEGTLPTVEIDFAEALQELKQLWEEAEVQYGHAIDENTLVTSLEGGLAFFKEQFGREPAKPPYDRTQDIVDLFSMVIQSTWRYMGMSSRELDRIQYYTKRYVRAVLLQNLSG